MVDKFVDVLAALSADKSSVFGASGARVELLRRIDGVYSTVQQVSLRTESRTVCAYIKIPKPRGQGAEGTSRAERMLEHEYHATLALYETLRDDPRFGVVKPLAWLPEHRALVTEEVEGRPLGELLLGGASTEELVVAASRIGAWINQYEKVFPASGSIRLEQRRAYLDDRLTLLQGRVLSAADRRWALNRFDVLADEIGSATLPAVAIHADFTPYNIIVGSDGRVTVLDFTMAKIGTQYNDLAHLWFHLELIGTRRRGLREACRDMQRALLGGYTETHTSHDPLFRLMLLQHGVCHVAMMAERRVPIADVAYRWFMRRRWRLCERIHTESSLLQVA
jgi:hypothetical protein